MTRTIPSKSQVVDSLLSARAEIGTYYQLLPVSERTRRQCLRVRKEMLKLIKLFQKSRKLQ